MKIAFAGTPEIAATILQSIIDKKDHQVVCVITSVDKPSGRGRKFKPSPVKKIALENNLTLMQPDSPKSEEFINEFKNYQCDVLLVVAYGHQYFWSNTPSSTAKSEREGREFLKMRIQFWIL